MATSILIHSESNNQLFSVLNKIESFRRKNNLCIYIHTKNFFPDEETLKYVYNFEKYSVFQTNKNKIDSIIELILGAQTEELIIFNGECLDCDLEKINPSNNNYVFFFKKQLLELKLDNKYKTFEGFVIDLKSQFYNVKFELDNNSVDYPRYENKINHPLFWEKIIYIDGGLGDHIMALPFIESLTYEFHICCKYPSVYQHINTKGFINWDDNLFGGYIRSVYEFGFKNQSNTIIDAFFGLYGKKRLPENILKYNGLTQTNYDFCNKKICLVCISAAKINNQDSNKDWEDIRWFNLIYQLKKMNYFVIQVGTHKDSQIPNVDYKFLDKSLSELKFLLENSTLWISVDTFFHHFASAIKPNVGICLTPYYNDHAKHMGVIYIEKDCGKNFSDRKWWLDLQQPERKECMKLISVNDVLDVVKNQNKKIEFSLLIPVHNDVDNFIFNLKSTLKNSNNISEIVIYSNGTTEEGNKKLLDLKNEIPNLRLHIINKPIGFVKAINNGIKLCKNEHIICLNSDATLGLNWEDFLTPLCNNPTNGLIGPVLSNDFILGCCFIVKKSVLYNVGFLNEGFGFGYEDDVELSYRIKNNNYNLGFFTIKNDLGKTNEINFPLVHNQGSSFSLLDKKFVSDLIEFNRNKYNELIRTETVIVFKNSKHNFIKNKVKNNEIYIAIIKSGSNFESIRYDDELLKKIHLFECTPEMDIDQIIRATTINKKIKKIY